MFFSNILTVATWKFWLQERVLWRLNSAMPNQLSLPPWDLCSVDILIMIIVIPNSLPGGVLKGLAVHLWMKWQKSIVYVRGCNRLTVKGSGSGPLSFSSVPLLLSSSLPQPKTTQAAGPMWDLRTCELLTSFSVFFLPLFLSSLALPGLSMVVVFYPVLRTELWCGSGELVALCFGLLTSKAEQLAGGVEILLKYCKKVTVC